MDDNPPQKGHDQVMSPILNFGSCIQIFGATKASCQILHTGRIYQVLASGWQTTP